MQPDWTPAEVTGLVGNPFYAINIDPVLAQPHPPLISEQDWINANVKLLDDLAPHAYLENLHSILKGNHPKAA
jgi:hypothetical protein